MSVLPSSAQLYCAGDDAQLKAEEWKEPFNKNFHETSFYEEPWTISFISSYNDFTVR